MTIDDQQIRKYLLGSASELDEEEISLRLIADEGLVAHLDRGESELIEDHLDGLLSNEEARLFRENFLVSPERRQLLQELEFLRAGIGGATSFSARTVEAKPPPKGSFFSFFSPPLLASAGLLVAVLAGFSGWYAFVRDGRTPLEVEYAALNRRDLADPAKTGGLYTISIIPSNFRDKNATAAHPASGLTDRVVLRLALMTPEPEGAEFEIFVKGSGGRVFTVPGRVFRNAFGSELRFMAPREIFTPGQHEIEARSPGAGTSSYQLRIE